MKNLYKYIVFLFIVVFFIIGGYIYEPQQLIDHARVLNSVCEKEAVFTKADLSNEIDELYRNVKNIPEVSSKILEKAKCIGETESGEKLYTSLKYQRLEKAVLSKFRKILKNSTYVVCNPQDVHNVLDSYSYLNNEQKKIITEVCNSKSNVNILIGRAGTGKTVTLKAIAEIYEKQGSKIIGMSLSSIAAENLEKIALIESNSIDYWVYHKWALKSKKDLKNGDIMLIDEAGMIGTDHWKKILNAAEKFKMKIIIVGDCSQFKPIAAGDCLRLFVKESPYFELKTILRQETKWMREASLEFSKLNVKAALGMYNTNNKIHETNNINFVVSKQYFDFEKLGNSVVLCYTKKECNEINDEIRKIKKKANELGKDLFNINGKPFSKNEKIMFLKNNKEFDIKNGQMGIIKNYANNILEIKTDSGTKKIDISVYDQIGYAYAITLHKSQGKTFDNVIVVGSPKMDSKAFYVAMTRHRNNVELFYRKSDFSSFNELVNSASKYNFKNSLEDFKEYLISFS